MCMWLHVLVIAVVYHVVIREYWNSLTNTQFPNLSRMVKWCMGDILLSFLSILIKFILIIWHELEDKGRIILAVSVFWVCWKIVSFPKPDLELLFYRDIVSQRKTYEAMNITYPLHSACNHCIACTIPPLFNFHSRGIDILPFGKDSWLWCSRNRPRFHNALVLRIEESRFT